MNNLQKNMETIARSHEERAYREKEPTGCWWATITALCAVAAFTLWRMIASG